MTRSEVRLRSIFALLWIAIQPLQDVDGKLRDVKFFVNTEVEWQSLRGDRPQQFKTAAGPIYGPTQIIGLDGSGELALLSGYFNYDPKTRTFEFTPSEGFSVRLGKWEKTEDNHLKVEYRFALGEKLACPVGAKSYDDCYGFRYKQPVVTGTWSITVRADGSVTSIEAPLMDTDAPRHYVTVTKLSNRQEIMQTLRAAEKALSQHLDSSQ